MQRNDEKRKKNRFGKKEFILMNRFANFLKYILFYLEFSNKVKIVKKYKSSSLSHYIINKKFIQNKYMVYLTLNAILSTYQLS